MIGLHASINWNNGRMKVNLVVKGRAEHPLEHLYTECLREGLRQSLQIAHAKELEMEQKAKETNIKIEVAQAAETAAPLSEDAIEVPFELSGSEAAARPPSFSEFIGGLIAEFNQSAEQEKQKPSPNDDMIVSCQAATELVREKAREYMQRLMAWHQARAAAEQGGPPA